jgi:phosphoglycolate phosphatase
MSSLILPNNTLDNIKLVIFDKDGTLIDIHHYWCSMIKFRTDFFLEELNLPKEEGKKLYNALVNNMGIDLELNKIKSEGPVGLKPRSFIIDVAFETIQAYSSDYTREKVSDLFDRVDIYSKDKLSDIVELLDGVKVLLTSLHKAGVTLAIATTDISSRARLAMQSLDIENLFTTIAGADLVDNAKPSADLANYILKEHGITHSNTVVVGDSMADLGMAKNANTHFIGVRTGLFTDEFLVKSDNLIDTLQDIKVEL